MTARRTTDGNGEFRLEGLALVLIGGAILAAVVGAFFLGAWVERRAHPPGERPAVTEDPLAQLRLDPAPVETGEKLDFFDTVEGAEKQAEPARELAPEPAPEPVEAERPAETGGPGETADEDGPYHVQVFAGRDEGAASGLVDRLTKAGYRVNLETAKDGQRTLYKVRVGGYGDEDRARSVARDLLKNGYPGAWVTRVD